MITLYGMGSPNVLKVLLMLEETGLAYAFERVDVIRGAQRTPDFLALNPNGKVPVLVDTEGPGAESVTLFESGAILIYLAEKAGAFLPAAGAARYRVLAWLMLQMANLGPSFGQAIHFTYQAPEEAYARARFTREAARVAAVLEGRLAAAPYLAGSDYSIADMAVFPWIRTLARLAPELAHGPALAAWTARIGERPAARRMAEIAESLAAADRRSFRESAPAELDRYFGRG